MIKKYRFIVFVPFLLAGGCSSKDDKTAPEQSSKVKIFTEQRQALEKAKEVEGILQKRNDELQQILEEQSQ